MAARAATGARSRIGKAFARPGVRYLFLGKSGAILLGFPDTTQDADVFVEKSADNCRAVIEALSDLGFALTDEERAEILRGKELEPDLGS